MSGGVVRIMREQYGAGAFRRSAAEAAAILQKYGISTARLEEALREYDGFRVTVPFIGAFNTGKSSAINALLDMSLLPSSITANTTVPTEIVYGQNTMTVYRGRSVQSAGLHELRDRTLDLSGVTMLHLELESDFLKLLSGVKMVDMPGLDSGIAEHDRAMRDYLHNSLAYILMFSADEPVVKKSVAGFLSELGLREMPVYVVLSKCDKVPPEDVASAAAYLKEMTEKLLGIEGVDVYCVKAKAQRDMTPLSGLLMRLEAQADGMRERLLTEKLLDSVGQAEGYIRQRLAGEKIPVSELQGRIEQLQRRGELLSDAVDREERRFAEEKDRDVAALRRQIFVNLRESKAALLSTLLSGSEAWPQADRLIIGVLAAGVPSEFTSALVSHLRALAVMLDSDLAGGVVCGAAKAKIDELLAIYSPPEGQKTETPEPEPRVRFTIDPEIHVPGTHGGHRLIRPEEGKPLSPRAERPPRPQGLDPATKAVLDRFLGSRQVFDSMPMVPVQGTRAARESAAQESLLHHVLPGLLSLAENCIINGIAAVTANIHDCVARAIEEDIAVRQRALEDIRREKTREDSKREARLIELETDINLLGIIKRGLCAAKGGADDGVL